MQKLIWLLLTLGCGSTAASTPPPAPIVATAEPSEAIAIPAAIPPGYVEMHAAKVIAIRDSAAVLLVDEAVQLALPIFIGGTEGASIDYRMRGEKAPRPLTHDLLDTVLRKLGGELVKVHVDSLRDGVFHGSVFIRAKGRIVRIDARPSDAIALAIGSRVPIYVARTVLDEAGMRTDELRQHMNQGPPPVTG